MSAVFWEGVGVGAVVGWVLTELAKQFIGQIARRESEKGEAQRKLLREDIDTLSKRVEPLLTLAQDYYGKPSHDGKLLATQIKAELKFFAAGWNSLDRRITDLKEQSIGLGALVSFRKALTGLIDESRPNALDIDDPRALAIFNAAFKVKDVLSQAKYRTV